MPIRKEEVTLYSLSLLKNYDKPGVRFTKDQVAMAMDISPKTLDLYMTNLKRKKMIERNKKKYVNDFRDTYTLTDNGIKESISINDRSKKEFLTPEKHNIPTVVPITLIMERIDDPLEKTFFLTLYTTIKFFDLPMYLETLKTAKQESTMVNALSQLTEAPDENTTPVIETFFNSCFYGDIDTEKLEKGYCYGENVDTLLIVAEASYKQGRLKESLAIYDHLLSNNISLNQGQWFMARIGKALVLSKFGEIKEAISLLDDTDKIIDNKILSSFALQVKARILSTTINKMEAKELFDSAIRSFSSQGVPLLLGIAYNNRGILHLRLGNVKEAESDWNKARKFLKDAKSEYSFGAVYANLADLEIHKNNLIKAEDYLERSLKAYMSLNDLEGAAIVDFNYALLNIGKGELDKALEFMNKAETIAYPSPSIMEREEWRRVFIERAERNGIREVEFIN